MAEFNHGAFVAELRKRRGSIPADLYLDLMVSLQLGLDPSTKAQGKSAPVSATDALARAGEPPWLALARTQMGLKEIPGPRHESRILAMFAAAKAAWIKDDETPWCAAFIAWCMVRSGLPIPPGGTAVRALAWKDWGVETRLRVGALGVFGRQGGGHVAWLVGQGPKHLYGLGANQSNQVNIMPLAKERLVAVRWPEGVPADTPQLPRMSGGTVSTNEA